MICAGLASVLVVLWVLLAVMGGRSPRQARRVDLVAAATFAALALASLALFRLVVVEASREHGPLPFFVFLGVPIGGWLAWVTVRLARSR